MSPDQLDERLLNAFEQNAQIFSSLSDELRCQIKTIIDSQAESLGLVTREEFDALRISLNRALARVESLEKAGARQDRSPSD